SRRTHSPPPRGARDHHIIPLRQRRRDAGRGGAVRGQLPALCSGATVGRIVTIPCPPVRRAFGWVRIVHGGPMDVYLDSREARPVPGAAELLRAHLETAEWLAVRRGLGLMSGGLAAFPVCALGLFLVRLFLGRIDPVGSFLTGACLVGLLCGGLGFVAGVGLTLMVPRRAQLGRRVRTCLAGLIGGVVLLVTAVTWRDLAPVVP